MLSFIDKHLHKKAFSQALKEVDEELNLNKQTTNNASVSREYKSEASEESVATFKKIKSALSKPETSAVDLKNFKNWRSVEIVEPAPAKISPKKSFLFDDEDEGDEPQIEMPNPVSKRMEQPKPMVNDQTEEAEPTSVIDILAKNNSNEREVDKSFDTFFAEKFGIKPKLNTQEESKEEPKPVTTTAKIQPNRNKTNLNAMFAKYREQAKKKEETVQSNNELKDDTLGSAVPKVEVVDFGDSKPVIAEPPKKKVVNRKPRGKSKRRFDADVISSIDWK